MSAAATAPAAAPFPPPESVGRVQTQIARLDLPEGLRLEGGGVLPGVEVAYETYGTLRPGRDNAVFICHALTGDAHVAGYHTESDASRGWWEEMVGPGKGVDTNVYFVVCANILGGCKGTTGPSSMNPATGQPYGAAFPEITVGDIVNVHRLLLGHLGIARVAAVIGGSLGGMQALEWTVRFPESVEHCICIASGASLSTQALAFDVVGRKAITEDPGWRQGDYYTEGPGPVRGLAHARMIGHITYLSPEIMARKFGRERQTQRTGFQVESYLDHQGAKFIKRFDANSYLAITRAMDEFDLAERAGTLEKAFATVQAKVLIVALSADWLFPPEQSIDLANALLRADKHVSYCKLYAPHGHDAFLVDIAHLTEVVRAFLPWVGTRPDGAADAAPEGGAPAHPPRRRFRLWHPGMPTADTPPSAPVRVGNAYPREYDLIVDWVKPGSRVLDLGCGNGTLLTHLARRRQVRGIGIEIDLNQAIDALDRGHAVFQEDMEAGLQMLPDGAYDYAVLSETMQVVRQPRFVLGELLRVAREGIVSFPNFAKWSRRLALLAHGRMPKDRLLPFEWYDTPNIHLFTLKDFIALCREERIRILELRCLPSGPVSNLLVRLGATNLGADRVLARVAKE